MNIVNQANWGHRGEIWVIFQFILIPLHFAIPLVLGQGPWAWFDPFMGAGRWIAIAITVPGLLLALGGAGFLGRNLTALPQPKADSKLVTTGPYAFVRHPIYGGLVLLGWAWAVLWEAPVPLTGALVLTLFFRLKAHQEEKRLVLRYPDYVLYRKRTRALIPWVF